MKASLDICNIKVHVWLLFCLGNMLQRSKLFPYLSVNSEYYSYFICIFTTTKNFASTLISMKCQLQFFTQNSWLVSIFGRRLNLPTSIQFFNPAMQCCNKSILAHYLKKKITKQYKPYFDTSTCLIPANCDITSN